MMGLGICRGMHYLDRDDGSTCPTTSPYPKHVQAASGARVHSMQAAEVEEASLAEDVLSAA